MMRALIVDDEAPARELIRHLAASEGGVEIIAECATGAEAIGAIRRLRPDLVFLDIRMPDRTGFDVLEAIAGERLPHIIFITAYDRYAVKAFEVHALDYLLKPLDEDRFRESVARARHAAWPRPEAIAALLAAARYRRRIAIRQDGRASFLPVEQIHWIEAEGNYVRLHTGGETILVRETLRALEQELDPAAFCRIHRGVIVNLARVRALETWFHGDARAVLDNGRQLPVSRAYRQILEERIERW